MQIITVYNYSECYRVLIDNFKIKVFEQDTNTLILEQKFTKVFTDGEPNSLLVQVSECGYEYMWIGHEIIRFMSYEQIVDYKSPLGPNQVPYPWAVDSRGWVYLFLDYVVITCIGNPTNLSRVYEYYWFDGLGNICPNQYRATLIKNFQLIQKFFIGDDTYNLTYSSFPEKEYERLVQTFQANLYVEKTDGAKYPLDKKGFCKLMKEFGEVAGLLPLDHMVLIHKAN